MNNTFLPSTIRSFFPALGVQSGAVCYFDNAATAYMPQPVIDALQKFYSSAHGNVHRAVYEQSEQTTSAYEQVRAQVQQFVHAALVSEIIFTSGTTDSINGVAHMWAYQHLSSDDAILITQAEHHANYVLWQEVARRTGATLLVVPLDSKTLMVDTSVISDLLIRYRIRFAALTLDSNVLGPIWGAKKTLLYKLLAQLKKADVTVLIDAAQTVAHEAIDVQALDCDFLAFSAHKMGGPTGLGVLYARAHRHEEMVPYRFGGGMVATVAHEYAAWQKAPHCFEAGTPPIAQVVAFGALLDFYDQLVSFQALRLHEARLCEQLIQGLSSIAGVEVLGNTQLLAEEGHVVTFFVEDIHAHDIAQELSRRGICVRAGNHCAQPLSSLWQERATIRTSMFMYNTSEEIDQLVTMLHDIITEWRALL